MVSSHMLLEGGSSCTCSRTRGRPAGAHSDAGRWRASGQQQDCWRQGSLCLCAYKHAHTRTVALQHVQMGSRNIPGCARPGPSQRGHVASRHPRRPPLCRHGAAMPIGWLEPTAGRLAGGSLQWRRQRLRASSRCTTRARPMQRCKARLVEPKPHTAATHRFRTRGNPHRMRWARMACKWEGSMPTRRRRGAATRSSLVQRGWQQGSWGVAWCCATRC